ncbi:TIGR03756 family integrating conjugative element protein [Alteromonas sp. KUL42]|uniref:TIGR03756 family integrating conjugative element protein n=1 Tax=Alteromonas sp. KUL42 TaxID=2480797 RepID=UPI00215B618D|nr:TIGR03756 family integrating conjugative element protein [Alteromonas sp. KUL42]
MIITLSYTASQTLLKHLIKSTPIALVIGASALISPPVRADVSFDDFIKAGSTDTLSCAAFELKGTCFWMKCDLSGCSVKTTAVIEHYTPDVFVSIYDSESPEPISGGFSDFATGWISNTTGTEHAQKGDHSRVANTYRLADVYGSPSSQLLINLLESLPLGLACEPGSTPFKPYFISRSNPWFWNTGLVDGLLNFTGRNRFIGEREDGQFNAGYDTTRWGFLYPRAGVVLNHDHFKASSVIAQRSMDIVFNGAFGLYRASLDGPEGQYYLPEMEIEEWSSDKGKWQMLYPNYESECHIFGDKTVKEPTETDIEGWSDYRSEDGDYVWHYWRKYECCKRPDGYFFLWKVKW